MSGSGTCMSALNAMCSVVDALASATLVFAAAVTAGAANARATANAATPTVMRLGRFTMSPSLSSCPLMTASDDGSAGRSRSMEDRSSVDQEHLAGDVRRAFAREPRHECARVLGLTETPERDVVE